MDCNVALESPVSWVTVLNAMLPEGGQSKDLTSSPATSQHNATSEHRAQVAAEHGAAGMSPPEPQNVLSCLQSMHVSHSRACCSPGASTHHLAWQPAGVHGSHSHEPASEGAAGCRSLECGLLTSQLPALFVLVSTVTTCDNNICKFRHMLIQFSSGHSATTAALTMVCIIGR